MSITITATANQPVTSDINTPRTSKEIPFIDGVMTFLFLTALTVEIKPNLGQYMGDFTYNIITPEEITVKPVISFNSDPNTTDSSVYTGKNATLYVHHSCQDLAAPVLITILGNNTSRTFKMLIKKGDPELTGPPFVGQKWSTAPNGEPLETSVVSAAAVVTTAPGVPAPTGTSVTPIDLSSNPVPPQLLAGIHDGAIKAMTNWNENSRFAFIENKVELDAEGNAIVKEPCMFYYTIKVDETNDFLGAKVTVKVNVYPLETEIPDFPSTLYISYGSVEKITPDSPNPDGAFTYEACNKKIVSVDEEGNITTKSIGSTIIHVRQDAAGVYSGWNGSVKITVLRTAGVIELNTDPDIPYEFNYSKTLKVNLIDYVIKKNNTMGNLKFTITSEPKGAVRSLNGGLTARYIQILKPCAITWTAVQLRNKYYNQSTIITGQFDVMEGTPEITVTNDYIVVNTKQYLLKATSTSTGMFTYFLEYSDENGNPLAPNGATIIRNNILVLGDNVKVGQVIYVYVTQDATYNYNPVDLTLAKIINIIDANSKC